MQNWCIQFCVCSTIIAIYCIVTSKTFIQNKTKMPCSVCCESGHNKTTCRKKFSTESSTKPAVVEQKCTVNVNVRLSKIKTSHDVYTQPPVDGTKNKKSEPITDGQLDTKRLDRIKTDKIVNRRVDENKNFISKVTTPIEKESHNKKNVIERNTTNRNTVNLNRNKTNTWKDIKIENGDKDILCDMGLKRFLEGPTDDDGEGYIYMYTYSNSKKNEAAKQSSSFKIGMTKNLPERRIQILGNENNEKYVKIHSEKVCWRRLAENLIHKELTAKGYHSPRKDVKGGTEWFRGDKDEILKIIRLVIRFLNAYALPLQVH